MVSAGLVTCMSYMYENGCYSVCIKICNGVKAKDTENIASELLILNGDTFIYVAKKCSVMCGSPKNFLPLR